MEGLAEEVRKLRDEVRRTRLVQDVLGRELRKEREENKELVVALRNELVAERTEREALAEEVRGLREEVRALRGPTEPGGSDGNLQMKVASILNELQTVESTDDTTSRELVALVASVNSSDTPEAMDEIVTAIYNTAIIDDKGSLCADLCLDICKSQINDTYVRLGASPFRRALVNRCQIEFESLLSDATPSCLDEHRKKAAFIRFICELFKRELVTVTILDQVLRAHLAKERMSNSELIAISALLLETGEQIDTRFKERMDIHIKRLEAQLDAEDHGFSPSAMLMASKVIEIRGKNWEAANPLL
eukprot:TRINITY_DN1832_c0_g1_i2.p1 TRINITY_DN1832_c0_g1~~TRINITY_DN1832_c0_g1_i2.p1  ORF type:complete len:305 (+),score=75.37 TRINITY_DN1832_c0_g1_i2:269-1183(+)